MKDEVSFNIVAYRDVGDTKHFELMTCDGDFTKDVRIVEKFVAGLVHSGGEDMPEDVAGGLMEVKHPDG